MRPKTTKKTDKSSDSIWACGSKWDAVPLGSPLGRRKALGRFEGSCESSGSEGGNLYELWGIRGLLFFWNIIKCNVSGSCQVVSPSSDFFILTFSFFSLLYILFVFQFLFSIFLDFDVDPVVVIRCHPCGLSVWFVIHALSSWAKGNWLGPIQHVVIQVSIRILTDDALFLSWTSVQDCTFLYYIAYNFYAGRMGNKTLLSGCHNIWQVFHDHELLIGLNALSFCVSQKTHKTTYNLWHFQEIQLMNHENKTVNNSIYNIIVKHNKKLLVRSLEQKTTQKVQKRSSNPPT